MRPARRWIFGLLALMIVVLMAMANPMPGWAAERSVIPLSSAPSIFDQGPASSDQLALYSRIAAVNTCLATRAGQDFEQAAAVAGETIGQLILAVHQGLIASAGSTPLPLEELRKGSINAAVIGATEICPSQVPVELADRVRQALTTQASATSG